MGSGVVASGTGATKTITIAGGGGVTSDAQGNTVGGTNSGDSFSGTSAIKNTLFGYNSGTAITSGDQNTSFGYDALKTMTTTESNTAVGFEALRVATGDLGAAFGSGALRSDNGNGYNAAFGAYSGYSVTSGSDNSFLGYTAGNNLQTGNFNICIGSWSRTSSTSVSRECTIGANQASRTIQSFRIPGIGLTISSSSNTPFPTSGSQLHLPGNAEFVGVVTATSFVGDGSALTGISGSIAGISTTGTSNFANIQLIGITTGLNVSGVLTAAQFSGDGANLTSLPAAQLSGTAAAINGSNITNLAAANLSGTLPALDGSALTGIAVTEAPITNFTVTANGSSAYRFAGGGVNSSSDDPNLYLIRGQKYRFNNTTGSNHPFRFRLTSGGSTYSSGVSGSESGVQFFMVPLDAPEQIVYQCTIHSGMVGNIYIRGGSSTANISNNANNRVITGGALGNLNGEAGLTFDGTNFNFSRQDAGDARMYIYGGEGGDARLLLASDEGDDHIDTYEIRAQASDNALAIYQFESGSYVQRFLIDNGGKIVMGNSTTSTTQLDIRFTDTTTYSASSNHVNGLKIFNDSNADNAFAGIELAATDADDYYGSVLLKAIATGTNYSNDFALQTRHSGTHAERLRITSNGKSYFMGNSSGGFNATTLPNGHTVNINTKVSNDGVSVIRYSGSYAAYALNIGRSKSDTLGTNSIVADGDDLGHITWYGADGTDFNQAAAISVQVDGTPSGGDDMPGRLVFKTTPDGSGTPTDRVVIKSTGRMQVNLPSTSGSSSAISNEQAIVGTKHVHTVYHNFSSTNSGLVISNVIPTNAAGTVDIMGGWANGNGIVFKRFVWCASGDSAISQVFSTGASRYGVSVSVSTPTMSISGDYVNFNFTFSDSQGSKLEKLKIHFEYHKQFYV